MSVSSSSFSLPQFSNKNVVCSVKPHQEPHSILSRLSTNERRRRNNERREKKLEEEEENLKGTQREQLWSSSVSKSCDSAINSQSVVRYATVSAWTKFLAGVTHWFLIRKVPGSITEVSYPNKLSY